MNPLVIVIYVVFAVAALLTLWRIIVGPSILDRAVASDVLLTLVMCTLGADMVMNHHTRSLPALLIIAAVGVFGSIAIARFGVSPAAIAPAAVVTVRTPPAISMLSPGNAASVTKSECVRHSNVI